ncbi:MAG: Maf family protein [Ginsengibacter sp.]|jgi:septum formation protein
MKKIILASASPRRKQLLELAEITFEIRIADTDETFPEGLPSSKIAEFIAAQKASFIKKELGTNSDEYTIIAADTIVVLDENMLGKPIDRAQAVKMLTQLSGKTHEVITGVCIVSGNEEINFSEKTEVSFHPLLESEINHYVDEYKPYDKAGGYAIQEWIGAIGIQSIKGDFYNVMGLPISRVIKELDKLIK